MIEIKILHEDGKPVLEENGEECIPKIEDKMFIELSLMANQENKVLSEFLKDLLEEYARNGMKKDGWNLLI